VEAERLAQGKKNAARLCAHIVFADESGFLLIPHVVKTWAPRGQTPVLRHRYRRDKISVISGVSVSPKRQHLGLFYQLYFNNIGQEEVCVFLRDLLRHLRGPVIAILDNSSTHHGEPLAEVQRRHPRLHVEYFPAYAPELNPDEGVWSLAKRQLANGCPHDVEELMHDLIRSINGIRRSPSKLRGCIQQSELPPFLR